MDCIFCKIVNRELPSFILHEDDDFLVILDRSPASTGHALIISKKHADDIFGLGTEIASKVMPLAVEIAERMKLVLEFDGLNIIQNNSPVAGQTICHFHTHLIPRYKNDSITIKLPTNDATDEELKKLCGQIVKVDDKKSCSN